MAKGKKKSPDAYQEYNVIKNFVENLNQNIIVIDTKEKVIIWNSQMELQFFSKEEVFGKPLKKLFPNFWEEFRGKVWGTIITKEIIKKGITHEITRYPLTTKFDKIRYFDIEASPFKNNNNDEIIGCIIIMEDVTDKINLENQLLRHARTTSLANLGASIAHEIRNPLNSISLNIQLIKEDLESDNTSYESTLEITDNVLYEINRLNKIITNFLKFSRPPQPRFEKEDLNQIIQRAVNLIKEEARQENVEIITNLGKLPLIPIDQDQIYQAIYNIIINAIHAMREQNGGKLEVSTLNIGKYILLEIKDNGPGLPIEDTSKLFDLFFTTKQHGTGLGLPVANQIIEKHEGTIVAENNLSAGACFSIYIPVQRKGY